MEALPWGLAHSRVQGGIAGVCVEGEVGAGGPRLRQAEVMGRDGGGHPARVHGRVGCPRSPPCPSPALTQGRRHMRGQEWELLQTPAQLSVVRKEEGVRQTDRQATRQPPGWALGLAQSDGEAYAERGQCELWDTPPSPAPR